MAIIEDYEDLQEQISLLAGGSSDSNFAAGIRLAIQRAEAEMNTRLRVPEMMVRSLETVDEKWESLPPGFIALRAAWYVEDPDDEDRDVPIKERRASPERIAYLSRFTGCPKAICLLGGQYRVEPRPDDDEFKVRLLYYRTVPDLSEDDPCTAILTRYPSLYLNGALSHLDPWLVGDPRLQVWQAKFYAEIEASNAAHSRRVGGGA